MEKRLIAFLAIAFVVLMLHGMLTAPKPGDQAALDHKQPGAAAEGENADAKASPEGEANDQQKAKDGKAAQPDAEHEKAAPPAEAKGAEGAQAADDKNAPPQPTFPESRRTLGSVDSASGYKFGITLNSRGAAVERLELSEEQFHDINDQSGYLGQLAATDAPGGGALVGVVVPGTPAAKAGLQVDDIITRVGETDIETADNFRKALSGTQPNTQVSLTYRRGNARPVTVQVSLTRRPLEIIRPERENIEARGEEVPNNLEEQLSFLLTLQQLGDKKIKKDAAQLDGVDLFNVNWEIVDKETDDTQITFRYPLAKQKLDIIKRYRLKKPTDETTPGYDFDLDVEFRSLSESPRELAYRLYGPNGLPVEGWWYGRKISRTWSSVGVRDLYAQFLGQDPILVGTAKIAIDQSPADMADHPLLFAGIDAQYFAAVMIPRKENLDDEWIRKLEAVRIGPKPDPKIVDTRLVDTTSLLISKPHELEARGGQPWRHTYQVFAGPKRPDILAQYGQLVAQPAAQKEYTLETLVYYGWPLWAGVAKVMTHVLHFFYIFLRNYGLAIILLTVLVRGMMFPLSRKQALNMIKMQELQPEIKKIAEKYKDDMEKRTRAQQELFRKHNYNPMGGCLVMFLQLPVFLGLYKALMVDIALRDAPLISNSVHWCSNLAAPDMLYNWSWFMPDFITHGRGLFSLGPYLNILPLITVGLFIFQQKMFMPPPADDQAALQQKIMKYMMIFMGIMFFKVPSGLCLYFIASTLWGMGERKLLPKRPTKGEPEATPQPTGKEGPSLMDRIINRLSSDASGNGRGSQGGGKRSKQRRK